MQPFNDTQNKLAVSTDATRPKGGIEILHADGQILCQPQPYRIREVFGDVIDSISNLVAFAHQLEARPISVCVCVYVCVFVLCVTSRIKYLLMENCQFCCAIYMMLSVLVQLTRGMPMSLITALTNNT